MKVGDLVKLSAYGEARQYNAWLVASGERSNVGLIIKVNKNYNYPYVVRWADTHGIRTVNGFGGPTHSRLELKYAHR